MPTSVGPNTKGEENLVFSYDLGDVSNSFKGEPAFNAASSLSDWNTYRSTLTSTTEIKPPVKGATVYVLERTDTNSGVLVRDASPTYGGGGNNDLVGLGDGNWKYSIWVKGHSQGDSSTSFQIDIGDRNSNGLSITPTTPWTRVTTTDAAGLNSSNYEFCDFSIGGALNNKIYVSAVMISSGSQSHPQWLPSKATRSATQGLIDLTGNSTIDLTNVSFDSNAQMTFDGTNDSFEIGTYVANQGNVGSIEVVFKAHDNHRGALVGWGDLGTSNWGSFEIGPSTSGFSDEFISYVNASAGSGYTLTMMGRDSTAGSYKLNDNQYHHAVAIVDGTRNTIYVDGEEVSTLSYQHGTGTASEFMKQSSTTNVRIGNSTYNGGHIPFDGEIPLVKIYNRALTASEIKANYNAIKGRFNI